MVCCRRIVVDNGLFVVRNGGCMVGGRGRVVLVGGIFRLGNDRLNLGDLLVVSRHQLRVSDGNSRIDIRLEGVVVHNPRVFVGNFRRTTGNIDVPREIHDGKREGDCLFDISAGIIRINVDNFRKLCRIHRIVGQLDVYDNRVITLGRKFSSCEEADKYVVRQFVEIYIREGHCLPAW